MVAVQTCEVRATLMPFNKRS